MNEKNFTDLFRFSRIYEKSTKSINKSDPWGVFAHQALDNLSSDLLKFLAKQSLNEYFTTSHCQGAPSMPRITWISVIVPRTRVSHEPSYTICFGRAGLGLVNGLMLPSKINWPNLSPIIRDKCENFINIDGTKSDLKYNNRYINPQEIYADNFNIEKLLSHMIESLTILRGLKIN
jgi:hypothetical protein